jgi:hypothetical protein
MPRDHQRHVAGMGDLAAGIGGAGDRVAVGILASASRRQATGMASSTRQRREILRIEGLGGDEVDLRRRVSAIVIWLGWSARA